MSGLRAYSAWRIVLTHNGRGCQNEKEVVVGSQRAGCCGVAESKAPHFHRHSGFPNPVQSPPEFGARFRGEHLGGPKEPGKDRLAACAGSSPPPRIKTPQDAGDGGHRRGQGGDLPVKSQREPPDTRKKVSMSANVAQPGPTRPPRPAAPQPRSPAAPAAAAPPPGIFSPRPPAPQRPASLRGCGVSAGGGGRCACSSLKPLTAPPRARSRRPRRSEPRRNRPGPGWGGGGVGLQLRPTSRPSPTSGPGVLGKRAGVGAHALRERDASCAPRMRDLTLRDPGFDGAAASGGRGVAVTCSRMHRRRWASSR